MVRPAPDFPDDEYLEIAPGWELGVVNHRRVATKTICFDGERKVDARLVLPPMSGAEVEGVLARVEVSVRRPSADVIVPAVPGHFALTRNEDKWGDPIKSGVVAWRVGKQFIEPVTLDGWIARAVLFPDGHVEEVGEIDGRKFATLTNWTTDKAI